MKRIFIAILLLCLFDFAMATSEIAPQGFPALRCEQGQSAQTILDKIKHLGTPIEKSGTAICGDGKTSCSAGKGCCPKDPTDPQKGYTCCPYGTNPTCCDSAGWCCPGNTQCVPSGGGYQCIPK